TSLPKGMDGDAMTLEQALGLLSLPRFVGTHPEAGEPIEAGIGRFGPYVKMGAIYGSLDKDDDVLAVGLNRAVDVLARKLASVRALGEHPKDRAPVIVKKGRFGPYIQHNAVVANVPRGVEMDDVTLEDAVALLAERGKPLKAKPGARKAKPAAKAPAAKKAKAAEGDAADGAKPAAAKKAAAKKATAKKPAAKAKAGKAKAGAARPKAAKAVATAGSGEAD
ncbi:MAG: topoisomerase C-terminal repeat-containing protein, partial [Janthinobacterium lividum]